MSPRQLIRQPAPNSGAASTSPTSPRPRQRESRPRFRRRVRATIVRRHDLYVQGLVSSVLGVLDAGVRKHHVSLLIAGELVLVCPPSNLVSIAVRPAVGVAPAAIPLLQELLILGLEVVLEPDAPNLRPGLVKALCFVKVRAVERRVVFQLPWSLNSVVERPA